jgi:hypothetical protein
MVSTKTKLKIWFYICVLWFAFVLGWSVFCITQGWWDVMPINVFSVAISGWNLYMASDLL